MVIGQDYRHNVTKVSHALTHSATAAIKDGRLCGEPFKTDISGELMHHMYVICHFHLDLQEYRLRDRAFDAVVKTTILNSGKPITTTTDCSIGAVYSACFV